MASRVVSDILTEVRKGTRGPALGTAAPTVAKPCPDTLTPWGKGRGSRLQPWIDKILILETELTWKLSIVRDRKTSWVSLFMVLIFCKFAPCTGWGMPDPCFWGNAGSRACVPLITFHLPSICNLVLWTLLFKDILFDIHCLFHRHWTRSQQQRTQAGMRLMESTGLEKTHHSFLALCNISQPFRATFGSHFKQRNHSMKCTEMWKCGTQ